MKASSALKGRAKAVRLLLAGALMAAALLAPRFVRASPEQAAARDDVAEIYKLQAAFHKAKTAQDLALMMSLWAPDGTMRNQGDPQSPYVGSAALKSYWQKSGSFMNRRFSLVPSYKTQIEVSGDKAWLYFECHDIGEYDKPTRTIAVDTFLAGTLRRVEGRWVFFDMTAGKSSPLSLDHYYFTKQDAGFQASR